MNDPTGKRAFAATFRAGKNDGISIGNQQAIIREAQIMTATALTFSQAGNNAAAHVLQEYADKMLARAMERRDNEPQENNDEKRI